MKRKLIKALRKAAREVSRNTDNYCWTDLADCNAGLVVQALCGLSYVALMSRIQVEFAGTWSDISKDVFMCPITNLSVGYIVRTLRKAGMSYEDLTELEFLANKKIRKAAGLSTRRSNGNYVDYDVASAFVKYVRAWATLLEAEGANNAQSQS